MEPIALWLIKGSWLHWGFCHVGVDLPRHRILKPSALSTPVPSVCSNFSLPSGRTKAILHSIHSEKEGPKVMVEMVENADELGNKVDILKFRILPINYLFLFFLLICIYIYICWWWYIYIYFCWWWYVYIYIFVDDDIYIYVYVLMIYIYIHIIYWYYIYIYILINVDIYIIYIYKPWDFHDDKHWWKSWSLDTHH